MSSVIRKPAGSVGFTQYTGLTLESVGVLAFVCALTDPLYSSVWTSMKQGNIEIPYRYVTPAFYEDIARVSEQVGSKVSGDMIYQLKNPAMLSLIQREAFYHLYKPSFPTSFYSWAKPMQERFLGRYLHNVAHLTGAEIIGENVKIGVPSFAMALALVQAFTEVGGCPSSLDYVSGDSTTLNVKICNSNIFYAMHLHIATQDSFTVADSVDFNTLETVSAIKSLSQVIFTVPEESYAYSLGIGTDLIATEYVCGGLVCKHKYFDMPEGVVPVNNIQGLNLQLELLSESTSSVFSPMFVEILQ